MSSNEKFCLCWNDFERNISVASREIREEKGFFDGTLSCGTRQIQAHKLLYLKGVQFTDLQAVLNFMYHGEVNVAEELNSFLAVAEELKVKGLTQNNSDLGEKPTKQQVYPVATSTATQSNQQELYQEPQYEDDIQEVMKRDMKGSMM